MTEQWPANVPILIPVYNHGRTVGDVVTGCRALGAQHILVIDDGSTDGSGDVARAAGADTVLTLQANQGKGAALRQGLQVLADAGHHQVLTIDADLQHPPREALRLAVASLANPGAIWLGVRDMARAPRASRFGRWWTSLWTFIACGIWPQDNQTGLRVYPLPRMATLPIAAGRYAFEIESLVKAVWHGVAVHRLDVAVEYPQDRISHFHAWKDSWRTAQAFSRLVIRRLIPWPCTGIAGWRAAFTSGLSPGQLAGAAGIGAALGVAPIPGLQMWIALWLAVVFRLNAGVTLLASNISFGPLLAGWIALEVLVGHHLRGGEAIDLGELQARILTQGPWTTLGPWLGDWLVGAVPVMAACGLTASLVTGLGALLWRQRHA